MRWPWRRPKPSREDDDRADEAVRVTEEQATEARERLAESRQLASRFRELRERNHFAEAFSRALRD